ncbi:hypothetical protein Tco_0743131 [Tanacetum coccineum]
MSATEAEYIAASEAAMEIAWIKKFISGLGIVPTINEPIKMFCDNSAALLIANEQGFRKAPDTIIEDTIMFASPNFKSRGLLASETSGVLTDKTRQCLHGKLGMHAVAMCSKHGQCIVRACSMPVMHASIQACMHACNCMHASMHGSGSNAFNERNAACHA